MGADDLATQGARAPATMIFTLMSRINSAPDVEGFNYHVICNLPMLKRSSLSLWMYK